MTPLAVRPSEASRVSPARTATWRVKRGAPLNVVAKVMGHASTAILDRVYGRLDSHDVDCLIEMRIGSAAGAHEGHNVETVVRTAQRFANSYEH
jgi:hypothetical protein